MIFLNLAQMQDQVVRLLEENGFHFMKKAGLKHYFETPTDNLEDDARRAKELIKAQPYGSVLYFNVEVVK